MEERMMATFTPGPWEADGLLVRAVYRRDICVVTSREPHEDRANTRLIAAAPTLLDALRQIVTMCGEDDAHIHDVARTAIRKATGEQE